MTCFLFFYLCLYNFFLYVFNVFINNLITLVVLTALLDCQILKADNYQEYEVKAGFVLNFIKLTKFKEKMSVINLCVKDSDTAYPKFKLLEQKKIKETKISVNRLKNVNKISDCNLLFIARSHQKYEKQLLAKSANKEIVTIGETDSFISNGGIINFYREGSKVRFEVSKKALDFSKVSFSSKLLKIARVIL